jgi:hypothetical protein
LSAETAIPPSPQRDVACNDFQHYVESIYRLKNLPPSIQVFIAQRIGEMADRAEFFNKTDVIASGSAARMRRFIRAVVSGPEWAEHIDWYVWYEQGGRAYSKHIVLIEATRSGKNPRLLTDVSYVQENPCIITERLIAQHPQNPPPGWPHRRGTAAE